MTTPNPFEATDSYTTLRRRWYRRYLKVDDSVDNEVKRVLIAGAESTTKKIRELQGKTTFSSATRIAQLNLTLREIRAELKDVFGELIPVIRKGQSQAAIAAVDGMSETDRRYLSQAFANSDSGVDNYIRIERNSAAAGVQASIARVTKSDLPLSKRVYKSQALANGWVQRDVSIGILRGDSAQEIAATVRNHIRPDVPGGVSYAAMRLARTEINNAFHATSIALSQDRPWVESMAWSLSQAGDNCPICVAYSKRTYEVNAVPRKPHPHCRCFVTPILESYDVFLRHLTAGQYRDWIENAA